jgi:hypothetical protein
MTDYRQPVTLSKRQERAIYDRLEEPSAPIRSRNTPISLVYDFRQDRSAFSPWLEMVLIISYLSCLAIAFGMACGALWERG